MSHSIDWSPVTRTEVILAMEDYRRLGPDGFFAKHGFGPTTTYDLVWDEVRYPPKAILGAAYEVATGTSLAPADFEGGKTGAVKVLGKLGFTVTTPGGPPGVEVIGTRRRDRVGVSRAVRHVR